MPKVTIDNARGLVQARGSGVTITSDVTISGAATFTGNVTGAGAAVVAESDKSGAPTGTINYDCGSNVRYFIHTDGATASWVANLQNLGLSNNQATSLTIVAKETANSSDRTLTGFEYNGVSVAALAGTTLKVKKAKSAVFKIDVVKNTAGDVYVYAIDSLDL